MLRPHSFPGRLFGRGDRDLESGSIMVHLEDGLAVKSDFVFLNYNPFRRAEQVEETG